MSAVVDTIDVFDLDLDDATQMSAHGQSVALAGGDKAECPVAPSHPHWSAWQRAWSQARNRTERNSGAMGYRTRLMKAEVRRQMEHLPEHAPDPSAEVADEPRRRVGLAAHSNLVHISINATPFTQAIRDAANAAAVAFTDALDAVNLVMQSTSTDLQGLFDLVAKAAEPDVQTLRHGSAAICPRHGQTKGGTCMKCVRSRAR